MKIQQKNKGMTLIEIIVAIAILGILVIGFLNLFTSGFSFIMRSGDTSEATYIVQSQIETTLDTTDSDATPSNTILVFSSDGTSVVSKGNIETITQKIHNSEVTVTFFQPKY